MFNTISIEVFQGRKILFTYRINFFRGYTNHCIQCRIGDVIDSLIRITAVHFATEHAAVPDRSCVIIRTFNGSFVGSWRRFAWLRRNFRFYAGFGENGGILLFTSVIFFRKITDRDILSSFFNPVFRIVGARKRRKIDICCVSVDYLFRLSFKFLKN